MYPRSWVPDKVQRVLWYTYVGISDKERRVLWYTHVRNIAVLARFNHCTHGQTCTRAPVKIQTTVPWKTVTSRCLSRHRPYKLKKGKSREAQEWCLRAAMDSPLGKCYRACIKVSNRGELYFIFTLISSPFFLIFCPSHLRSIMRRLHDPPHQHVLVAMSMHFVRFHGPDEE